MSNEALTFIEIMLVVIGVLVVATTIIIDQIKNKEKYRKEAEDRKKAEDDLLESEGEMFTAHVMITDMLCGVNMIGYKTPTTIKQFIVKFKTDDGEILTIPVDEEYYHALDIGMGGKLTLIDGQINEFMPDDE